MEPIDHAAERMRSLLVDIEQYKHTVVTEQDTRLKIIDRVLSEVLGWPLSEISTEDRAGHGYIDYKLTVNGLARLIVEAKRDGRDLGVSTQVPGRAYKLNGPVFHSDTIQEGLEGRVPPACG